jgi:hypothetical protein
MMSLAFGPLSVDPNSLTAIANEKQMMIVELSELGFSTRDPEAMYMALMVYATDAVYEAHMTTRDSNETRVVYVFNRHNKAGFAMTCVYLRKRPHKRSRLAVVGTI